MHGSECRLRVGARDIENCCTSLVMKRTCSTLCKALCRSCEITPLHISIAPSKSDAAGLDKTNVVSVSQVMAR